VDIILVESPLVQLSHLALEIHYAIGAGLYGIVAKENCTLRSATKEGEVSLDISIPRDGDVRDRIFFAMADRRYAVLTMEIEHKSLENVFLALTDRSVEQAEPEAQETEEEEQEQ
jgi:hypothetical protein